MLPGCTKYATLRLQSSLKKINRLYSPISTTKEYIVNFYMKKTKP